MAYPILSPNSTWYSQGGTTVLRSSITEISIVDSYTPADASSIVSSWDASAAKDGSIMAYVEGTKLIIAGNGSGKIAMNEDSSYVFSNPDAGDRFTTCIAINGAEFLDSSGVITLFAAFGYVSVLTELDLSSWDVSNVENMQSAFFSCSALTTLNLSGWNVTSNLTNARKTFYKCSSLSTVDVSNWDVSNVTDMSYMFSNCETLSQLDVSNWDVSNVTDMSRVFSNCVALNHLDVSNWDVSNVTDMSSMFSMGNLGTGTGVLTSLDVSRWNPASCINMGWMFYGNKKLSMLDVSNWDVSKVEVFHHCFAYCNALKLVGYENWDVSSVKTMNCMFGFNTVMAMYDLSKWDVSNVESFAQMFDNNYALVEVKGLNNWDTSSGKNFYEMFYACRNLKELDLSSFDTRNANDKWIDPQRDTASSAMRYMLGPDINDEVFVTGGLHSLEKITLGPNFSFTGDGTCIPASFPMHSAEYTSYTDGYWYTADGTAYAQDDVPNLTAATYYYINPVWLQEYVVKGEDIVTIADAVREITGSSERIEFPQGIVYGIGRIVEANSDAIMLGRYKLNNGSLFGAFAQLSNLTEAPMFDTSNITNMMYMFYICSSLKTVPQYDTRNVTTMYGTFYICSSLTEVPLLDSSKVTSMHYMFNGCSALRVVPAFDMRSVTGASAMFTGMTLMSECWVRNIKVDLQVASGNSYGHLLTIESLIHLISELRDTGSQKTLTIGNANLEKIANTYVKLIDITDEMRVEDDLIDEKYPFEVCESTDEGAMLITDYANAKHWAIK